MICASVVKLGAGGFPERSYGGTRDVSKWFGGVLAALALASPAAAVILPEGAPPTAPSVLTVSGATQLGDTGPLSFASNVGASDFGGFMEEWAYQDPANMFGAGDVTFVIEVTNNVGSTNNILRVSTLDYTGFETNVGAYDTAGFVFPTSVDRAIGGVVGFNFDPGIAGGQQSEFLVIQTDASSFTGGFVGEINDGSATEAGFAPFELLIVPPPSVPETATWVMLVAGFGLLGFVGFRRRSGLRLAQLRAASATPTGEE
jgi:hypothetical protein